jgi:hypothetical protein
MEKNKMKRTISYETFLDKVYGCFIGKAVSGNIGAPHEGLKMPMELPFLPLMIDCERPNDDLDLQVLWLEIAEKKGANFTAYDLLKSFCENCDYSPGEYAVMRKNYARGVYPPYSGKFCNDYYTEGMGCPIRSEVWGCLAIGNMELAKEFSTKDGQLDHYGESILAEHFMAALECEAFFEDDLHVLIERALTILPEDSKFREMVCYVVELCKVHKDMKVVLTKLLYRYGHPDCTNMWQNMGITIASLLLGDCDIIKTSMMALNCGFDTDCTCATAGAVIGILRGADELKAAYDLKEATYVLGVRCDRRSDKIFDLAEDIAHLAVEFTKNINSEVCIEGAPEVSFDFEPQPDFVFEAQYEDMNPSILLGGSRKVTAMFTNRTGEDAVLTCTLKTESNVVCDKMNFEVTVPANGEQGVDLTFTLSEEEEVVNEINLFQVTVCHKDAVVVDTDFGIVGASVWKLCGPFWRTEPISNTENIMAHITDKTPYKALMVDSKHEGNLTDQKRHFHLNFEADLDMAYLDEAELFTPVAKDYASPIYEQTVVQTPEDSFGLEDFFGFQGPCTAYLSKIVLAEEEKEVYVQIGYTCPFKLYINDELVAERRRCDNWTAENVHLEGIKLHKGENKVALRITRMNAQAKFNVTFAEGWTCATHVVGLATKNPYFF